MLSSLWKNKRPSAAFHNAEPRTQQGMTTIEVVAALLLFSLALIPIVQVQLNAQRNSQIVTGVRISASLERQALNYLQTVNFARRPTGTYDFGYGSIRWRAALLSDDAQVVQVNTIVGLYRVEVDILPTGYEPRSRVLHSIGWRPVQ